jgi:hypothetical protein
MELRKNDFGNISNDGSDDKALEVDAGNSFERRRLHKAL